MWVCHSHVRIRDFRERRERWLPKFEKSVQTRDNQERVVISLTIFKQKMEALYNELDGYGSGFSFMSTGRSLERTLNCRPGPKKGSHLVSSAPSGIRRSPVRLSGMMLVRIGC